MKYLSRGYGLGDMRWLPTFEEYARKMGPFGDDEKILLCDPKVKELEKEYERMVKGRWFRRPFRNIDILVRDWYEPGLSWKDFDKLDAVQANEYNDARDILLEAICRGHIDYRHMMGKVLDLEYGRGGSCFLLDLYSDDVRACGASFADYLHFNNSGIKDDVIASYDDNMLSCMNKNPEAYDLITAFDLDCYRKGDFLFADNITGFLKVFNHACSNALKPGGRLLVSASLLEMDYVRQEFGARLCYGDNPRYMVVGKGEEVKTPIARAERPAMAK
jgi:hypothetical protein